MRICLTVLTLALVLTAGAGCGNFAKATDRADKLMTGEKAEEVLIPIEAAYPHRDSISAYFETTSRVEAENRVEVVSKGMGQCLSVGVEEGDKVKAGNVLAELDKEELEAQLRQTRVNVQQNKYQMEKAEEQLSEGLVSPYEAENARFMYEQAQATLNTQEVNLKNQTILAPISGVITHRNIQQGMLVSSGMPAFTIVDPESYILPIKPPEKELTRLREGQEAKVSIDSRPGEEFVARVRRINPSVDPISGTVKVTLDFDDETRPFLREKAFARVRLVMETRENVLVVPKDTLIEENARTYLMAVRESQSEARAEETPAEDAGDPPSGQSEDAAKEDAIEETEAARGPRLIAERVEIQTGLEDSDNVEIVSGVDESTLIVTLGQHTLKPGSAVRITDASTEILSRADMSAEEALDAAKNRQINKTQQGQKRLGRHRR